MRITIDIDTSAALSEMDQAIIRLLTTRVGMENTTAEPEAAAVKAPATRTIDKIAETKAAAAAAKAKAEAALAIAAAEAAADADAAVEEDLVGGAEPTLQDAVDKAVDLVSKGQQALVKKALAAAGGARRVSELKGAAIGQFLAAVNA